jgi:hypothetical protein
MDALLQRAQIFRPAVVEEAEMAVIVEHKQTRRHYYLIGTGFGMYRSSRPGYWGGALAPVEEEGQKSLVAVCDANGTIGWFDCDDVRVVEVDGVTLPTKSGDDDI